jgi:hypothetical protein
MIFKRNTALAIKFVRIIKFLKNFIIFGIHVEYENKKYITENIINYNRIMGVINMFGSETRKNYNLEGFSTIHVDLRQRTMQER